MVLNCGLTITWKSIFHQVRDELEHLLDDDEDMAEMYLSDKLAEHLDNSTVSSMDEQDGRDDDVLRSDIDNNDRHVHW